MSRKEPQPLPMVRIEVKDESIPENFGRNPPLTKTVMVIRQPAPPPPAPPPKTKP